MVGSTLSPPPVIILLVIIVVTSIATENAIMLKPITVTAMLPSTTFFLFLFEPIFLNMALAPSIIGVAKASPTIATGASNMLNTIYASKPIIEPVIILSVLAPLLNFIFVFLLARYENTIEVSTISNANKPRPTAATGARIVESAILALNIRMDVPILSSIIPAAMYFSSFLLLYVPLPKSAFMPLLISGISNLNKAAPNKATGASTALKAIFALNLSMDEPSLSSITPAVDSITACFLSNFEYLPVFLL